MLTRLEVDGFKNLVGLDVRFGPFTCIAGPNGVGKSNLFDAIAFLSRLAEEPLMDAAMHVRGASGRPGDVGGLFHRVGDRRVDEMRLAAEMLIPAEGEDPLGQRAEASMTYLRYEVRLRRRPDPDLGSLGRIELVHESMRHIKKGDARTRLGFRHAARWRESVVRGRRTSAYISTTSRDGRPVVQLHADSAGGRGGGRPRMAPAHTLPRTMLSSINNAAEHRTLVLARQEMASWVRLQLEPSALRAPSDFSAPRHVAPNGAHLAAALHRLVVTAERRRPGGGRDLRAQVANRLAQLVEDTRDVRVEVDGRRRLLALLLKDRHDTEHPAAALSDGTLRFLALAVLEQDPEAPRLLCLEEPENGVHPGRIAAMVELLEDLAVDRRHPVGEENPLRQVIVNTHSPSVVACVPEDSLLVASLVDEGTGGPGSIRMALRPLSGTWRATDPGEPTVAPGDVIPYLDPFGALDPASRRPGARRRVVDRADLQLVFPFWRAAAG